jgi:23S rRNA (cytosine1962-C5)-methyltransferase
VLYTFSCSGGISADLFHKIVAGAGADAGVDGHPAAPGCQRPTTRRHWNSPKGEYLKGLAVMRK